MPEISTAKPSATEPKSKIGRLHTTATLFHEHIVASGGYEAVAGFLFSSLNLERDAPDPESVCALEDQIFAQIGKERPEGWESWDFSQPNLEEQRVMKKKVVRASKIRESELDPASPAKPTKVKAKAKKEAIAKDLRSVFNRRLAELDVSTLTKPWMATKALRLIESPEDLKNWIHRVQSDTTIWKTIPHADGLTMPVIALDTETHGTISSTGLDTRLVQGRPQIDVAGICLCADGMEAIYIPISHEGGPNVDRVAVRELLQPLFDSSYLVFFNAKFDREVCRVTMGLTFRDFPYFEDVQVDNYLLDPKADLDEEVASMGGNGLKDLSIRYLGIEQIELDELTTVKAQYKNPRTGKVSVKNVMAPFSWVPPRIAVLYAAADALTTWLLWDQFRERAWAKSLKFVFKLDHMLIDTLTWIERQRFLIDVEKLVEVCEHHRRKMEQFRNRLAELSGIPDFNPGSSAQLGAVLFEKLGFQKGKVSEKTGVASTDKTVIEDLKKQRPGDPFLTALSRYRSYASLHPQNLEYDPRDHSARMFFKQCTVAGGRLAAQGGGLKSDGSGQDDGGFGLNPQAIKGVKGNKWVQGRQLIFPSSALEEAFDPEWLSPIPMDQLHESVLKRKDDALTIDAPDIINGVANYMGRWWSFRPEDSLEVFLGEKGQELGFTESVTIPISEQRQKVDSNEVVNLRGLFIAPPGYVLLVTDYSNIEMRVAANTSKEPKFILEFNEGSGDFHTLTATSVFPEFSAPGTDKVTRKTLRDLAKIINFALLYGGTEHTIFENMKRQDPTITKERAKEMVDAYWASVPKFAEWAYSMKSVARKQLACFTPDGRKIDFRPVMIAEGIPDPDNPPTVSYNVKRAYWDLRGRAKTLKAAGRKEEALACENRAKEMWDDPDLGLKAASTYNKLLGKIERVSVNVPLQGLAGDLMRRALTLIHRWAERTGIEGALLVHATVHDEIDFCIRNEFVPYVLPRLTRYMKLRDMHKLAHWPVPIECDCEYGTSWDVKFHLTGDDGHVAAAYTNIPGLENYVPPCFDPTMVEPVLQGAESGDEVTVAAAAEYLRPILHERVHDILNRATKSWADPVEAKRLFIAAFQLHEYWEIDQDEEGVYEESIEEYMDRMGIQPFPGLGARVLSSVNVETLPPLEDTDGVDAVDLDRDFEEEPETVIVPTVPAPAAAPLPPPPPAPHPIADDAPVVEPVAPEPAAPADPEPELRPGQKMVPRMVDGAYVLRTDIDLTVMAEICNGTSLGSHSFSVLYDGQLIGVRRSSVPHPPLEVLELVAVDE